jgi:hypothetical protein
MLQNGGSHRQGVYSKGNVVKTKEQFPDFDDFDMDAPKPKKKKKGKAIRY